MSSSHCLASVICWGQGPPRCKQCFSTYRGGSSSSKALGLAPRGGVMYLNGNMAWDPGWSPSRAYGWSSSAHLIEPWSINRVRIRTPVFKLKHRKWFLDQFSWPLVKGRSKVTCTKPTTEDIKVLEGMGTWTCYEFLSCQLKINCMANTFCCIQGDPSVLISSSCQLA